MTPCRHNSLSTTSFDSSPLRPTRPTLAVHSHHHRPFTATTPGRSQTTPKCRPYKEDKAEEEAARKS